MASGIIEIITGRERRRRWSVPAKRAIVAESLAPGARAIDVAARHDLSPSLLYGWRRRFQAAAPVAIAPPSFVPVRLTRETEPASAFPAAIEITLADGARLRLGPGTPPGLARAVIAALRG